MYGVMGSLNLGSTWMLTLENEVIAICIAKHCLQVATNLQLLEIFFQVTRPKPKHRALILFGLFLMWTFYLNFEFHVLIFVVAICFLHWLFLFMGFLKGVWRKAFRHGKMFSKLEKTNWGGTTQATTSTLFSLCIF